MRSEVLGRTRKQQGGKEAKEHDEKKRTIKNQLDVYILGT